MKKILTSIILTSLLCGCTTSQSEETKSYTVIDQQTAKQMMDSETNYVILDVRRFDEYNGGHIPNAILIPNEEILERAEKELLDKDQLILVYCRSGNRSKQASAKLVDLGYTNVYEFGGIITWPYEIVQ